MRRGYFCDSFKHKEPKLKTPKLKGPKRNMLQNKFCLYKLWTHPNLPIRFHQWLRRWKCTDHRYQAPCQESWSVFSKKMSHFSLFLLTWLKENTRNLITSKCRYICVCSYCIKRKSLNLFNFMHQRYRSFKYSYKIVHSMMFIGL